LEENLEIANKVEQQVREKLDIGAVSFASSNSDDDEVGLEDE
jgi:uncharacterized membrane protein